MSSEWVPLARSADLGRGIREQTYVDHVMGVRNRMTRYWSDVTAHIQGTVANPVGAADDHDFGKLLPENQAVLRLAQRNQHLPVNHVDAGVAKVMQEGQFLHALLIYAHHQGLPDLADVEVDDRNKWLRDMREIAEGQTVKTRIYGWLPEGIQLHERLCCRPLCKTNEPVHSQMEIRMMFSCLVDADHTDAQEHEGIRVPDGIALDPAARLERLNRYVESLFIKTSGETDPAIRMRAVLRRKLFETLRDTDSTSLAACNAPVGSGKTTAVLANLLNTAMKEKSRRVFIVAPYTAIIDQTVDVLRSALVGKGEDMEKVIAAHHHRVEFSNSVNRRYAFGWHAPFIVATAVQFFETLASNHPGALRKLHNLPGSVIFIDEAHAALPPHLWLIAWKWLEELSMRWGCRVVLGSGSLVRYWEIPGFLKAAMSQGVVDIVPEALQDRLARFEEKRVEFRYKKEALTVEALIDWIYSQRGPRLCIVNTVQAAAVIARRLADLKGRSSVEHMSTALAPIDRAKVLARIRERLKNPEDDEWVLVSTSCLEAGVDLSFPVGFRELTSLTSIVQTGGRVSRNGETQGAILWVFRLLHDRWIPEHRGLKVAAEISTDIFSQGLFSGETATKAVRLELMMERSRLKSQADEIMKAEKNGRFPKVVKLFQVINEDTVTAVINQEVADLIAAGEFVTPTEIMQHSVSITTSRLRQNSLGRKNELIAKGLKPLLGDNAKGQLFRWTLEYDDFLGYMTGVVS